MEGPGGLGLGAIRSPGRGGVVPPVLGRSGVDDFLMDLIPPPGKMGGGKIFPVKNITHTLQTLPKTSPSVTRASDPPENHLFNINRRKLPAS